MANATKTDNSFLFSRVAVDRVRSKLPRIGKSTTSVLPAMEGTVSNCVSATHHKFSRCEAKLIPLDFEDRSCVNMGIGRLFASDGGNGFVGVVVEIDLVCQIGILSRLRVGNSGRETGIHN